MFNRVVVYALCAVGVVFIVIYLKDATDPAQINVSGNVTALIIMGLFPVVIGIALSTKPFETACLIFILIAGGMILFGTSGFWMALSNNALPVTGIFLFLFVLILSIYLVKQYNIIMQLDEKINKSWGDVQVGYQKRLDMITSLLKTVKKYLIHEDKIMQAVAKSRQMFQDSDSATSRIKSIDKLEESFSAILLNVERYPDLRSDKTIIQLMDEIGNNENNISSLRNNFNQSIILYNKLIRSFPTIILSKLYGFNLREYFQAELAAASKVDFDSI